MTRARYDDVAQYYEGIMRPFERWVIPGLRMAALREIPAGARTLEVGAGTGLNFVHYPAEATGVASEVSGEMLKIAGEKQRPGGVALLQNCAEDLPFQNASFDAAFATLVFCSVASPVKALAELRRVVRSGGTVVLLEHVRPSGVLGVLFDFLNLFTSKLFDDHINRQTAKTASDVGLEVVKVERSRLGIINLITCRV
ncbi:MAG: SAM-dependent methyltransferase [Acidobacteria bacterium]|nr:MAG: SAM-dependent methyltransferase [Acidobacteriota bacterium]